MSPSAQRSAGIKTVLMSNFQSHYKIIATELLSHVVPIKMCIPAGFILQGAVLTWTSARLAMYFPT